MHATRNALFAFVVIVSVAAVACQPTDGLDLVGSGARTSHPVIEVPAGATMLPPAPVPTTVSAAGSAAARH